MITQPQTSAARPNPLDAFKECPAHLSPIEQVAYDFAKEKHTGQFRHKKMPILTQDEHGQTVFTGTWQDVDYPYDVHLHLVHHLLREAGVRDEAVLAAAFMHDMIEDCTDAYGQKYTKETLKHEFTQRLNDAQAIPSSGKDVDAVVGQAIDYVKEVSNPPLKSQMTFGKRLYQSSKQLSSNAKLLKISDQTASLVEDVKIRSQKDAKLMSITTKARDVVVACQEDNPSNNFLRAVEDEYYRHGISLLRLKENFPDLSEAQRQTEEQKIRDSIQLKDVLARAKDVYAGKANTWLYQFPIHPEDEQFQAVELDEHGHFLCNISLKIDAGQVAGIRIIVHDANHALLKDADAFIKHIEEFGSHQMDAVTRVKSRILKERVCFDDDVVKLAGDAVNDHFKLSWGDEHCNAVIETIESFKGKKETSLELGFHVPMSLPQCLQVLQTFPNIPTTRMQEKIEQMIAGRGGVLGRPEQDLVPIEIIEPKGVYAGRLIQYREPNGRFAHHPDNTPQASR